MTLRDSLFAPMRDLILFVVLSSSAHAAPFLVMDVQPEADRCTVIGLPAPVPATVDEAAGLCKFDLAGLPVGAYSVTATVANMWDVSEPSAPFAFTRPPSTSIPAGLRLAP